MIVLNCAQFKEMLASGANNLANKKEEINKLNVFPVPDGDTGTNMFMTFGSGVEEAVKAMTRRAIKMSSFIMWPLMIGLGVCAEPIVRLILTEKWLFCVPYLRIFCFTYAFYPIHTANLSAIKAMGRSDMFLTLEIIKKVKEEL